MGSVPLTLSRICFIQVVRAGRARNSESFVFGAAMSALVAAAFIFHIANPHQVIAGRYVTLAIAPFLALAAAGIEALSAWIQAPKWRHASQAVLCSSVPLALFPAKACPA